jgi:hypothetical protein
VPLVTANSTLPSHLPPKVNSLRTIERRVLDYASTAQQEDRGCYEEDR